MDQWRARSRKGLAMRTTRCIAMRVATLAAAVASTCGWRGPHAGAGRLGGAVPTLRDRPFGGASSLSLDTADGASWTASAEAAPRRPVFSSCAFKSNVDWNEGGSSAQGVAVADPQACCRLCNATAACAGSVFAKGLCYVKTAADVAKGLKPTTRTCTACVPNLPPVPPPPPTPALTVPATVPGDLVSDLEAAGVLPDPLFETNFRKNVSLWAQTTWTYRTTFDLPALGNDRDHADLRARGGGHGAAAATSAATPTLVLDGVKMGAIVKLNGQTLGTAADQFLRYTFDVASVARPAGNTLEVVFDPNIPVDGRFMACAAGWDWAPRLFNVPEAQGPQGFATYTRGLWKSVSVVMVERAAISHVVPLVEYLGPYPTSRLQDHASLFQVRVQVHLAAPADATVTVAVEGAWGASNETTASIPMGNSSVELLLPAKSVALWWPNGEGEQTMYNLTATVTPAGAERTAAQIGAHVGGGAAALATATRRVGFRTAFFVTVNDTDPASAAAGGPGTGAFSMRFRVNGLNLYTRGANMIPTEALDARVDAEGLRILVQSAADAHFNMLRVWGGGIWQYQAFYDAADDFGVMLFHDAQYAQQGHSPEATPTQAAELEHQVRRLSEHPSVVVYDGCNECDSKGRDIYTAFVMSTIAAADPSRAVWPSCPAAGWASGVHRLTSLPNGDELVAISTGKGVNDSHGPYVTGNAAAWWGDQVDEDAWWHVGQLNVFEPDTTAHCVSGQDCTRGECREDNPVYPVPTGSATPGWFKSEFGCSVWSSFESMAPQLSDENYGLHAPPMTERNWPADDVIFSYFGTKQDLNATGEAAFKRQLYQSMIGQMLFIKAEVEGWRSSNLWGTLIWQFNEIWPTGGWGSIEYGARRPGQVLGGRWKPLHYQLMNSVFADVTGSCCLGCAASANCYVKNDGSAPFDGVVTVEFVEFAEADAPVVALNKSVSLGSGAGAIEWLSAGKLPPPETYAVVLTVRRSSDGSVAALNTIVLAPPKNLTLAAVAVKATAASKPNDDGSVDVEVSASGGAALFVVLTTKADGRFSDNAFMMRPGTKTVRFLPFGGAADVSALSSTLRVEHLQQMV